VGQNKPREIKSVDFDVNGFALEGPGLKTGPGKLKTASRSQWQIYQCALEGPGLKTSAKNIEFTSPALLWRALGSKQAPDS
jgi:hypothetical protein